MFILNVPTLTELVGVGEEFKLEYDRKLATLLQEYFDSKMVPHLTRLDVSVEDTKKHFHNDIRKMLSSTRRKKPLDIQTVLSKMEGTLVNMVKEHPREVVVQVTFGDKIYCQTVQNNPLVNLHFTLKDSVTYEVNGPGWLQQVLKTAKSNYAKDGEVFVTDNDGQRYDSESLTTPPLSTNPVLLSLTVVSRQMINDTQNMYRTLIDRRKYSTVLPPCPEKCIQKVHEVEAFAKNMGCSVFPVREMTPPNVLFLNSALEWLNAVHESVKKLKLSSKTERLRVVGEFILRKLGGDDENDDENDVEKPPKKVRTSE